MSSTDSRQFTPLNASGEAPFTHKPIFGYTVLELLGQGRRQPSDIRRERPQARGQVYALKHVVRKNDKDIRFIEQLEAEHAVGQHVQPSRQPARDAST